MTFGLDPKHARGLWHIVLGIVIAQYVWRTATRHRRMSASLAICTKPLTSALRIDRGELMLAALVATTIGMIWAHLAPDVSNIAFPNQWP
jgi:hypothetical protein